MFLAGLVMAAPAALAVSPHFINASATVNSDGSLTVNFKEAGLGTNQLISRRCAGDRVIPAVEYRAAAGAGSGSVSAAARTVR
jgi:hypothetical protein